MCLDGVEPFLRTLRTQDGELICGGEHFLLDAWRAQHYLLMPDDVNMDAFNAWLPAVGRLCGPRGGDAYDVGVANGHGYGNMDSEVELREQLGQHADAIEAAGLWIERWPHQPYTHCVSRIPMSRSHLACGRMDRAAAGFVATIEQAQAHRMHFLEMIALREYGVCCLGPSNRRAELLPALGRALASMALWHGGDLGPLTQLLGHGFDGVAALARFEAINESGALAVPAML